MTQNQIRTSPFRRAIVTHFPLAPISSLSEFSLSKISTSKLRRLSLFSRFPATRSARFRSHSVSVPFDFFPDTPRTPLPRFPHHVPQFSSLSRIFPSQSCFFLRSAPVALSLRSPFSLSLSLLTPFFPRGLRCPRRLAQRRSKPRATCIG